MKTLFMILSLFVITACGTPAPAAILVMSSDGLFTKKTTLSAAATDADTVGKTIVVTTALSAVQSNISSGSLHAWPTNRTLRINKGGSVNPTTTFRTDGAVTMSGGTFNGTAPVAINGSFESGDYHVFTGSSTVTGLKEARPEWFGAVENADSTVALQKMLASSPAKITTGNRHYISTDTLVIPSDIEIDSLNIDFQSSVTESAGVGVIGLDFNGVSNINIVSLNITASGAVRLPIYMHNACSYITVDKIVSRNDSLTALTTSTGLYVGACSDIHIKRIDAGPLVANDAQQLKGVELSTSSRVFIDESNIINSRGEFGDGIYTYSLLDSEVRNVRVNDVTRIGVVVEGDGVTLANNLIIDDVRVTYAHDSIAAEINGGVWVEGGKSTANIWISNVTVDNLPETNSRGLQLSNGAIARDCVVSNVAGIGAVITGTGASLLNSTLRNNRIGIEASPVAGYSSTIKGNIIYDNTAGGVQVYQSHGTTFITGNTIKDNGSAGAAYPNYGYGLRVSRYYNDQNVIIDNNTFVSSANAGDTDGQLYSIVGVAGGDVTYRTFNVAQNRFLFTGTLATYPADLGVAPSSFGYDSTSAITAREIVHKNHNSKVDRTAANQVAEGHLSGALRYLGFISAAPTTGDFLPGDYYLNSDQRSVDSVYAWVCTDDAPLTWKKIVLTP